jgi:hypothetical protein
MNPVNGSVIHQGYLGNNLINKFIRLDDVNGDGYTDIMPGKSGNVAYVISGYDGSHIWSKTLSDQAWNIARIPDVSGDNINDVVVGTLFQNSSVYFLDGTDGTDLFSESYGEAVDAIGVLPDITGDGSWEMVAGGRDGKVVCYSGGLDTWVGISDDKLPVSDTRFVSCYPNPFTEETTLTINLPFNSKMYVNIYDLTGTIIWNSQEKQCTKGTHEVKWKATNNAGTRLKQGIYIYEIVLPGKSTQGKVIFMGE